MLRRKLEKKKKAHKKPQDTAKEEGGKPEDYGGIKVIIKNEIVGAVHILPTQQVRLDSELTNGFSNMEIDGDLVKEVKSQWLNSQERQE